MADRLAQLTKLLEKDPADPFLLYGIALEHKKAGRLDEALDWLGRTLEADEGYCYAYYQQGQTLEAKGDTDAARTAYQRGIGVARRVGDGHAAGELQVALDLLD